MTKELLSLPVEKVAPLIKNKRISPVELTEGLLGHAEKSDEQINAYISMRNEKALEEAKQAEKEILQGHYRGMYHGIPMAIKDNIYVKNEVTTMASKIHANYIPEEDATVVKKLKEAGVILTGKLNLHEYAWGATTDNPHYGPCRNPWDLEKIPGGSSGGSGASVISDTSFASIGTDTGGSIRIPSSACGIVGLKPTHGRVSKHGVFPLAWTLDHVGPMTKTVKDAAGLLEVISGFDKQDPTSARTSVDPFADLLTDDVSGLVIGLNEDYYFNQVDSEVEQLVRNKIMELVDRGATVKEVQLPSLKHAEWAMFVTLTTEAAAVHQKNHLERKEDFGEDLQLLFNLGEMPSGVDYLKAQQVRKQIKDDFHQAFQKVDVIISPTLPMTVPAIGTDVATINGKTVQLIDHLIRFMGPANMTGIPSLSIPCGFKGDLPVGLQIMGPAFEERTLLNVGYTLEQMKPLEGRKPQLVLA